MITLDEALERLEAAVRPLGSEAVDLSRAGGRVLAETVLADRDFPPTDRSAMDGFAVRGADVRTPGATLRVAGEVRAGAPAGSPLEPGTAVRIYTGAVVPPGADTVVMVERTVEDPATESVRIEIAARAGEHVRGLGQDLRRGDAVLEAGQPIEPAEIAALASVGCTGPPVHRLPVVHLLSTGDEVVEAGATPAPHQVRNSNAPMLLACLAGSGVAGRSLGNAPDDAPLLAERVAVGMSGDLLLVTGGVSVGRYDLVRDALEQGGMRTLFHGIAMKPGKPILAGQRGSCLVVGLPGNPVSALAGFALLVAPALRRMMGYRQWRNVELLARLVRPMKFKPGRATYRLCRLAVDRGELSAEPVSSTGSGDVLSMARANGFLVSGPEGGDFAVGARLPAMLWKDFHLR